MPHTVEEHKFGRLTRSPKYDQYLDGQIYVWTEEELQEYGNGAATVRSGLYSAAVRNNMRLRSQLQEDGSLVAQAFDESEE